MSEGYSFKSDRHDVSDVLSSIRQLVSDEAQARRTNGAMKNVTETLVLTEADRIPEASSPPPPQGDRQASDIDREALRTIVREIIEEELAGRFGDRLNRNVRKIVRRAISQAINESLGD